MKALVTTRVHRLAGALAELKVKVRAALATELAGAVGTAVRDLLVVALIDRLIAGPTPSSRRRDEQRYDRDRDMWGEPRDRDPWSDADDFDDRVPSGRYVREDEDEVPEQRALPVAAAVAVGANVGRWWLARKGSVACALGLGAAAAALGLAGGPVAQGLIAVVAAATDVLTAESALARPDSF